MNKPESAKEIIISLKERFRPEKLEPGYESVFHLDISGERGGQYTVTIKDETIDIVEGLVGLANCVVSSKDEIYEDVEWERTNPQMAFMFGKIKVSNLAEMLGFISLFYKCPQFYK